MHLIGIKSPFISHQRAIAVIFALSGGLAACTDPGKLERIASIPLAGCIQDGRLSTTTFGAIESELDWRKPELRCEGMQRPRGKGARLRFAGEVGSGDDALGLAFILSIPDLVRGEKATELATRVTLIDEENARFFSTREASVCWSNVSQQSRLKDVAGVEIENHYRISGITYCVAPIAELNGPASITLSELQFTGQLRWARKKP